MGDWGGRTGVPDDDTECIMPAEIETEVTAPDHGPVWTSPERTLDWMIIYRSMWNPDTSKQIDWIPEDPG